MRSPRSVAVASLTVVVLLLAACGDDDTETATTTTAEETTTTEEEVTTTTEKEVSEEEAVVEAYERAWGAYPSFINATTDEPLETYFAGDRLATIPGVIVRFAEQGIRLEGAPVLAPGEVTVDGDTATFDDCLLDRTSEVVEATGEVADPPNDAPQRVAVTMSKVDGEWKLARVEFDELGSCTQ